MNWLHRTFLNLGCPCGSKVGKTECGLTAQILDKFLPRPCKNYKNGCKELLEQGLEGYEYHQKNCDFRMVNCPSIGCRKIVVSKLTDHLTNVHGFDFKQLIHCSPLNSWARDLRQGPLEKWTELWYLLLYIKWGRPMMLFFNARCN